MTTPTNSPEATAVLERNGFQGKKFSGMASGPEGTFFFVNSVEVDPDTMQPKQGN